VTLTTPVQLRYYESDIFVFRFGAIYLLNDVWGRNFVWNVMMIVSDHTVIHTRCFKYIAV